MTDFDARAREIATKFADNVHESLMGEMVIEEEEHAWLISAISSALKEAVEEAEKRWMLAQKALNKIDDAFEYRMGDEKSRAFIHEVLAQYTSAIRSRKETDDA